MNINQNGHLWRFVQRYNSWAFIYRFEDGRGDICSLVRGFLWAAFALSFLTVICFIVAQLLLGPFIGLVLTGSWLLDTGGSWIDATVFIGAAVWTLILALIAWALALHWYKGLKKPAIKVKTPEWWAVTKEYVAARKGRYCTKINLT